MVTSFTIKTAIRRDKQKKNANCPLNFLIRVGGEKLRVPVKIEVDPEHWNEQSGRLKKGAPNMVSVNAVLDREEQKFKDFMHNKRMSEELVDVADVKMFYGGENRQCFYSFYAEVVSTMKIKDSTRRVYDTTLKIMKEFRPKLNFKDINLLLIQKFQHHLVTERGNSMEGTFNRHKNFKTIINQAILNDRMIKTPYDSYKIPKPKDRETFLDAEEMRTWDTLEFDRSYRYLEYPRDLYSFGHYTGTRFSDILELDETNIVEDPSNQPDQPFTYRLEYQMGKTGKAISNPLLPQAVALISKYRGAGEKLFPPIKNQNINRHLKTIAEMAGIDKNVTFHVSRHSFASVLVDNDVPILEVRDLMGHTSVKRTERYAKLKRDKVDRSMMKLENIFAQKQVLSRAS